MYVRLPGHVQRCGDLHLHAAQVQLGCVQVVVRPLVHLSTLTRLCRIRLDFVDATLAAPSSAGACTTDYFTGTQVGGGNELAVFTT